MSANPRYWLLNEQICAARGEDARIAIDGPERTAHPRGQHHAGGGLHQRAAATSRSARRRSAATGTPPRRWPGCRWRSARTRRSCSARNCGGRPGSPCSSRPPTPARRNSRPRGSGPGSGSASAGSPRCSTCSRRTSATSPRCCRCCDDGDPVAELRRGGIPELAELTLHNGTVYRWNRPVYAVKDGEPHLRVENRVLPAGPTVADVTANAAFYYGLVRTLAEAERPIWTQMSFAAAGGEPDGGRPARDRRQPVLARAGRGAGGRADAAPPAAAGPGGAAPLGGGLVPCRAVPGASSSSAA